MTPETAAAIARRIGMRYVKAVDGTHSHWRDGDTWVAPDITSLSEYLATGDRPLRVWAALVGDGWRLVMRQWRPDKAAVLALRETGVQRPDGELRHAEGDTPAAAILACAEALEEGR